MPTATDVADFFIDLANNTVDEIMTNPRINNLLYYAQAYSLVRFGKPLFPDEIQAWRYGRGIENSVRPKVVLFMKYPKTTARTSSPEKLSLLLETHQHDPGTWWPVGTDIPSRRTGNCHSHREYQRILLPQITAKV